MNTKKIMRIYNLAMNGELDGIGAPLLTLIETLAEYPHTDLDTGDDLQRFVNSHARIELCLLRAVDILAKLPIWEGRDRDADAADLADDATAGARAWFADLAKLLERHDEFAPHMLTAARDDAGAAIARMAADLAAPQPAAKPAEAAGKPAAERRCTCGQPAVAELFGFPLCARCRDEAARVADDLLGGRQ